MLSLMSRLGWLRIVKDLPKSFRCSVQIGTWKVLFLFVCSHTFSRWAGYLTSTFSQETLPACSFYKKHNHLGNSAPLGTSQFPPDQICSQQVALTETRLSLRGGPHSPWNGRRPNMVLSTWEKCGSAMSQNFSLGGLGQQPVSGYLLIQPVLHSQKSKLVREENVVTAYYMWKHFHA